MPFGKMKTIVHPVIIEDGSIIWYLDEDVILYWGNVKNKVRRHRKDGPAAEYADGDKAWYLNGKLHREDGPAIEWINGFKAWYLNGKYHREDGSAIEYPSGDKVWFYRGKKIKCSSQREFEKLIKMKAFW